jgi:hypothetical protein
MNEAALTTHLKKKFEEQNFLFHKMADKSTFGRPDALIARHGVGMYVEFKYIEMEDLPLSFNRWSIFGKGIQMATMLMSENKFKARYIICIRVNKKKYYFVEKPSRIKAFFDSQEPMSIRRFYSEEELIQTVNYFLMDIAENTGHHAL